jgi:hypothetical protein
MTIMTPPDVKEIIGSAINQASCLDLLYILVLIIFPAIGSYLGSFIREKGKNLATKEDIGRITNEIESVKSIYTKEIEYIREKQQLRLAAIDKRLEAHQKAYSLWRKLVSNVHNQDQIGNVVFECQEWWINNCLYLSMPSRGLFIKSVYCAFNHKDFLNDRPRNIDLIQNNWADIMLTGMSIEKALDLPSLEIGDIPNITDVNGLKKLTIITSISEK